MKKIFALILALVLVAAVAGCASSSKYQDGTYTAKMSKTYADENSHGWQDTLTVTFKGGKMTEVDFDGFNADGARKSEQTAETYPMDPSPSVWIPQLEENIKKAEKADDVEAVSGATYGSAAAKELYAAVLTAAENGNTDEITLH